MRQRIGEAFQIVLALGGIFLVGAAVDASNEKERQAQAARDQQVQNCIARAQDPATRAETDAYLRETLGDELVDEYGSSPADDMANCFNENPYPG